MLNLPKLGGGLIGGWVVIQFLAVILGPFFLLAVVGIVVLILLLIVIEGIFKWLFCKKHADWKGRIERRFRWKNLRFEYGRYCYKTDCGGDILNSWWEWEK